MYLASYVFINLSMQRAVLTSLFTEFKIISKDVLPVSQSTEMRSRTSVNRVILVKSLTKDASARCSFN